LCYTLVELIICPHKHLSEVNDDNENPNWVERSNKVKMTDPATNIPTSGSTDGIQKNESPCIAS